VGSEQKTVQVHSAAIAGQSAALGRLVNGCMSEAQTHSANLPDVQPEDFTRFCQFAYCGDYTPPRCTIDELAASECEPQDHVEESENRTAGTQASDQPREESVTQEGKPGPGQTPIWSIGGFQDWSFRKHAELDCMLQEDSGSEYMPDDDESEDGSEGPGSDDVGSDEVKNLVADAKENLPKCLELQKQSIHRHSLNVRTRECFVMEYGVVPNWAAEENYTPVFLGHARLYVFAEKYGISTLRTLTLSKLHQTLVYFTLFDERIGDIIALVRYAYSNDNTPDHEGEKVDSLRRLVAQYIVRESMTFGNTEEFRSLLEEGGPFVRDLWSLMWK
jgi:hypothetical protein